MNAEMVSARATIEVSAARVFAVLTDPGQHAAIDGTGWVCEALDPEPITASGQVFRMNMFHPNHPDGNYEIHNLVWLFDQDRAVAWRPGFVEDPVLASSGSAGGRGGTTFVRSSRVRARSPTPTTGRP